MTTYLAVCFQQVRKNKENILVSVM
jgi:hypothetical protein